MQSTKNGTEDSHNNNNNYSATSTPSTDSKETPVSKKPRKQISKPTTFNTYGRSDIVFKTILR